MITLTKNTGYRWTHVGTVYFKGYFILESGNSHRVYRGEDACKEIGGITNYDDFIEFLKSMYGCWALIVERTDCVWAAVDIARSMPLYYSASGEFISDSAEIIRQNLRVDREDVDRNAVLELFTNNYLCGDRTVYDQIKQLDLGEAMEVLSGDISRRRYFYHQNKIDGDNVQMLRKKIETASLSAFQRLKMVIGNRPVVLSMSGGYDSRFVGCMLKKVGVEDVLCYTYGKQTSFEVIQSRKNAKALGFRWTCVEMTDELQKRNLDEVGQRYFDSYSGHDFTAYMQNFTAVRKLQEDGWIKPDSVFLTGLCGDMPTGEYIAPYNPDKTYDLSAAVDDLYNSFHSKIQGDRHYQTYIKDSLKTFLNELPVQIVDYSTWQSAIDCYQTGTSHSHWFMHMNSVHSFFGYEWLLPYWDKELLLAWYSVPPKLKYKQKFYEDWLMEEVFKPYGLSQKKSFASYSHRPFVRKWQYTVGGIINYAFLHLGIPFRRRQDVSNFAPFELELFKNIKNRSCIVYHKGSMMHLLAIYLLERRYGAGCLKCAGRHLVKP